MLVFITNLGLMDLGQSGFIPSFMSVVGYYVNVRMGSLYKLVLSILDLFKALFLTLLISCYTVLVLLLLSVILLSNLILLFVLNLIRILICGNS